MTEGQATSSLIQHARLFDAGAHVVAAAFLAGAPALALADGVVLIGEGSPARLASLLAAEKKRVARVAYEVPSIEFQVGNGEGQVPINKLQRKIMRLPRQLKPDEVQGGTFSITNFGSFGSVFATPVINQPQVAILGVGAVEKTPVVVDDAIAIRSVAYLALTFDHRLIDGALADQFTGKVKSILENWAEEVL